MPGLVRDHYNNAYWPTKFESINFESTLCWLEDHLHMVLLWLREQGLALLKEKYINEENVKSLAASADMVWEAIKNKDLKSFAEGFLNSFNAQTKMFLAMVNAKINLEISKLKEKALAWKLAGGGVGGYLILVSEKPIEGTIRVKIRRK
jgi:galactokinase/mevalonate kinase-like predicted kinase